MADNYEPIPEVTPTNSAPSADNYEPLGGLNPNLARKPPPPSAPNTPAATPSPTSPGSPKIPKSKEAKATNSKASIKENINSKESLRSKESLKEASSQSKVVSAISSTIGSMVNKVRKKKTIPVEETVEGDETHLTGVTAIARIDKKRNTKQKVCAILSAIFFVIFLSLASGCAVLLALKIKLW